MKATRKAVTLVVTTVTLTVMVSCSGGGTPSGGQFTANIDGVCRTLAKDLSALTKPTATDKVASFATDASTAYQKAVAALKKLTVPSGPATVISDAKSLVNDLDHQVDVLADVAAAAAKPDEATLATKTSEFDSVRAKVHTLATNLDALHCDLDPLFDQLVPPTTTAPPTTAPTTTAAPVTTAVSGASNKKVAQLSSTLKPSATLTFADVSDSLIQTWIKVINSSPTGAAASGTVAGVEVHSGNILLARVFIFLPDNAQPYSTVQEIAPAVTGGATATNDTINNFPGIIWTATNNIASFLGAQSSGDAKYFLYAVAPNRDGLVTAISGLWASLPN